MVEYFFLGAVCFFFAVLIYSGIDAGRKHIRH
jgi:hypothetical protein